jgi:hypothetical protein
MRAGTTSLHHYLHAHPEIFMSEPKELYFWNAEDCLGRLQDYKRFFPVDAAVRGESTVFYTVHPLFRKVPERIRSVIPYAKLIYVVRDPIDRAISQYVHEYATRAESRPFETAFKDLTNPLHPYIVPSRYATQLERYLENFPQSQILVLDQVELLRHRRETLRKVFHFLGVAEYFDSPRFDDLLNTASEKRRPSHRIPGVRHSLAVEIAARAVPSPVRSALFRAGRRAMSRAVRAPAVDEALRRRFAAILREEANRLRELTGKSFEDWSI